MAASLRDLRDPISILIRLAENGYGPDIYVACATMTNDPDLWSYLVLEPWPLGREHRTRLHHAAWVGDAQRVTYLCDLAAAKLSSLLEKKTRWGDTALHECVRGYMMEQSPARLDTLGVLIARGADINVLDGMGHSPLSRSLMSQDTFELTRMLLDAGAAYPATVVSALHRALMERSFSTAFVLATRLPALQLSQPPTGGNGWTALHFCAVAYDTDTVLRVAELLLDRGANVNARTYNGCKTPLDFAEACASTGSPNAKLLALLHQRGGIL